MSFIGVLMLDTAFPRIMGDAGNPDSYSMPVRIKRIAGADVPDIVRGEAPSPEMAKRFVDGALALQQEGASGIITTCGFLAHIQSQLSEALEIPVLTSALLMGPKIRAMICRRKIGILTADAGAMTDVLLEKAGLTVDEVAIAGMQDAPAWQRLILPTKSQQATTLDPQEIGGLSEEKAAALVAANPDMGAILLECANLPPYAARIHKATGLPVFHIVQAAEQMWSTGQYGLKQPSNRKIDV